MIGESGQDENSVQIFMYRVVYLEKGAKKPKTVILSAKSKTEVKRKLCHPNILRILSFSKVSSTV